VLSGLPASFGGGGGIQLQQADGGWLAERHRRGEAGFPAWPQLKQKPGFASGPPGAWREHRCRSAREMKTLQSRLARTRGAISAGSPAPKLVFQSPGSQSSWYRPALVSLEKSGRHECAHIRGLYTGLLEYVPSCVAVVSPRWGCQPHLPRDSLSRWAGKLAKSDPAEAHHLPAVRNPTRRFQWRGHGSTVWRAGEAAFPLAQASRFGAPACSYPQGERQKARYFSSVLPIFDHPYRPMSGPLRQTSHA